MRMARKLPVIFSGSLSLLCLSIGAFFLSTGSKAIATARDYAGVDAHQVTNWGIFETKACPAGIRIETQTGAILIATAPAWDVVIFRKSQKSACRLTYSKFLSKNRASLKVSQVQQRPRFSKVAGINAFSFTFDINRKLDETASVGSIYRSKQNQPFVLKKEVLFAKDVENVPIQAKEIWRSYFESPLQNEIPLETVLTMAGNSKHRHMETKSFKRAAITPADFSIPKGLEYSAQFAQVLYGNDLERIMDLLSDP